MDGSTDDIAAENNPSAVNAVSFELAMVDVGAWFGIGGFIDVPHAANLANQQFTIDAWVRPDGPGPTDDQFGIHNYQQRDNRCCRVAIIILAGE